MQLGGVSVGLDTATGAVVLAAAAQRRVQNGRPAVPTWLTAGKVARNELEPEAAELAEAGALPAKERVQLLLTCVLLLIGPLFFSRILGPVVDVLLEVCARTRACMPTPKPTRMPPLTLMPMGARGATADARVGARPAHRCLC